MNYYAFSALSNFICSVSAGFLVAQLGTARLHRLFVCFAASLAVWSGFYFLWQTTSNPAYALLYCRALMMGAIFIPMFYLHHLIYFLNEVESHKKMIRILYSLDILWFFSALTPWFVRSVEPAGNFRLWPRAGVLFTPFLLTFIFTAVYGVVLILRHLKTAQGDQRLQLRYVLAGTLMGWIGGGTNYPLWYGITFPPIGNIFATGYVVCVSYAILRHRLMDLRLVLRDAAVHGITAALLGLGSMVLALPIATFNSLLGVISGIVGMGFLMAFAYDPIRKALQPSIDRFVFANRFGYLEELSQLPNDMLEFTNLGEMLAFLLTRLKEAARLEGVRILMYDPGHQSYQETIIRPDHEIAEPDAQAANLSENSGLIQFLKEDRKLWVADDMARIAGSQASGALSDLKSLQGAACFPVYKNEDLMGVVILGAKSSKETFNQQDMKILRALRMRLENFFAQAMTITQEALNMVKDSHDMKNDVNVLKGRVTWRAMRIAGWKIEFEKHMQSLQQWLVAEEAKCVPGPEHEHVKQSMESLKRQALEWFAEAEKSRTVEEQTIQRLSHRLRNWAEYGRVVSEGFRGQRQMETIDVAGAVRMAVERWKPMAERKALALSATTPVGLSIWGERSLLEQIIENLIDNAVKATTHGSVQVICRKDGHNVLIEVRDSGCGIPAEDIATIFDKPFYQGKGRESLEQSTGVGLYLVAQYAKSLGGWVSAESQVGKGSTFRVTLPLHQEQAKKTGVAA